jgi:hypothetical protein
MMNRDVDVIGGLYPMKTMPVKWVVNGFDGADQGPDGLQEVSKTGTGFMLVKRHVFEKLNAHPAVKSFNNDIGLPKELDQHLRTYYDTAVRENRYYSEDWTFCENWRDIGGKIWVDKRVLLRHTGTYVFDFQQQEPLYRALHELAISNKSALPAPEGTIAVATAPAETPAATETVIDAKSTAPEPKVLANSDKKPAVKAKANKAKAKATKAA